AAFVQIVERDHARSNRVDGDLRRPRFGQSFGQHDYAGFRSAVVGVLGPRSNAAERADVHNASAGPLLHQTRAFLTTEEGGLQVDGVDEVPVGLGDVER